MYEAVLGGGRVHTASTRARASQTHARITPFGSVEAAHGAQVRMLPSNKKRKFVSTPRQGTEKDLERATQAASRIELFIVTKAGGGGLSQDNTRSGNKTLQCMLAALAKVEGIDVDGSVEVVRTSGSGSGRQEREAGVGGARGGEGAEPAA